MTRTPLQPRRRQERDRPARRTEPLSGRRDDRHIFAIGLALSVAVHAAALWAFRAGPVAAEPQGLRDPAMTLIAVAAAADPLFPDATTPPILPRVEAPTVSTSLTPTAPPEPAPPPAPLTRSVAEVLPHPDAPAEAAPATSEAPSPAAPRANPAAERLARGRYEQTVSHWLERYREYPLAARRRGWEGTAIVRLRLAADGSLLLAQIVRHTGHSLLDQAALGMIERAAPFPRLPEALPEGQIEILIPIQFSLGS